MADEEKKQPERNNFNLFKGLLFWIIAGIILLTLARFSGLEGKKEEIFYSRFINEVKQGNISGPVTIKEDVISGTLKDGKKFSTYKPDDPELFNILRDYNVDFKVEPSSNIWINIL
ncbi:MAG TPA: ATP-dependent metallopeptidase FtsH/Yme1/Tma family protein, partial [bacterium]|nr:ATP-dependent metallopeptidase FtsH/Yme1/Tma family protein [bacterium]